MFWASSLSGTLLNASITTVKRGNLPLPNGTCSPVEIQYDFLFQFWEEFETTVFITWLNCLLLICEPFLFLSWISENLYEIIILSLLYHTLGILRIQLYIQTFTVCSCLHLWFKQERWPLYIAVFCGDRESKDYLEYKKKKSDNHRTYEKNFTYSLVSQSFNVKIGFVHFLTTAFLRT